MYSEGPLWGPMPSTTWWSEHEFHTDVVVNHRATGEASPLSLAWTENRLGQNDRVAGDYKSCRTRPVTERQGHLTQSAC